MQLEKYFFKSKVLLYILYIDQYLVVGDLNTARMFLLKISKNVN